MVCNFLSLSDATRPPTTPNRFPLPKVPEGWSPDTRRVWEKDKENKENEAGGAPAPPRTETGVTSHSYRRAGMTADQVCVIPRI